MSVYRIKNDDNDDNDDNDKIKTKIDDIFENDVDGMIIVENGVNIRTDGYTVKYIDEQGDKYIVIGRRERNKLYKRQRINMGLLHVIDYRVNTIMNSIKILTTIVASYIIVGCAYYASILIYSVITSITPVVL